MFGNGHAAEIKGSTGLASSPTRPSGMRNRGELGFPLQSRFPERRVATVFKLFTKVPILHLEAPK